MQEYKTIAHTFKPVYDEKSKILILGSFPSVKSRENQFYYGHPQNRFWKVIAYVLNTDVPNTIEEKKELLLKNHIAIWDVIARCSIVGSSDTSIKDVIVNDFSEILRKSQIQTIYVNGTKAYDLYRKYAEKEAGIKAVKLPSTSPANAAWSLERLCKTWKERIREYNISNKNLTKRFELRNIRQDEVEQAIAIEQICFPPNEACSEKSMKDRIEKAAELFLVAVDKENGKIAGFLNGLSTNEQMFRDEFFTDVGLYDPDGKNIMLLGLDVLPEYRGQGLARELMNQYLMRERENNRRALILTCLQPKVEMYKKMGFRDEGIANSTWGGEEWHEMSITIE